MNPDNRRGRFIAPTADLSASRPSVAHQNKQEHAMAYQVFISYSHHDQTLRQKLDNHLANLKQQNIITSWYDGDITAGTNWRSQIMQHLNSAQIILLLI